MFDNSFYSIFLDLDEKLLCSKNHKLNGLYPGYYYNCYECKRYFMNHSKYRCFTCANSFCLECKGNEKDQESGKKDFKL